MRIQTEFSEPLCAGDLAELEEYIDAIEDFLGVEMEESVEIQLSVGTPESGTSCAYDRGGCYWGRQHLIKSGVGALPHELVHAVTGAPARVGSFVKEGIANGLDSTLIIFPGIDLRSQLRLSAKNLSYTAAAHFTRWLLERDGAAKWRDLFAKGGDERDFERVYGLSFEALQEEYLATAPWVYGPLFYRGAPPLASVEGGWREDVVFDCERDDTLGGPTGLAVKRRIEILERGPYDLWTTGERLFLKRIPPAQIASMAGWEAAMGGDVPHSTPVAPATGLPAVIQRETLTVLELEPGAYDVVVSAGESDTARVVVMRHLGPVTAVPQP